MNQLISGIHVKLRNLINKRFSYRCWELDTWGESKGTQAHIYISCTYACRQPTRTHTHTRTCTYTHEYPSLISFLAQQTCRHILLFIAREWGGGNAQEGGGASKSLPLNPLNLHVCSICMCAAFVCVQHVYLCNMYICITCVCGPYVNVYNMSMSTTCLCV